MSLVKVDEKVLRSLVKDSLALGALEAAGVDNWQGYDETEWPTGTEIQEELEGIVEA